jgi:hypothetical protein
MAGIGSTINEANASAAQQTAAVPAAAADQVSAAVATFWGAHAQGYQDISAQMASFHDKFVQALASGGASYAATEAAAAAPLQDLFGLVNAPAQQLLGRPAPSHDH